MNAKLVTLLTTLLGAGIAIAQPVMVAGLNQEAQAKTASYRSGLTQSVTKSEAKAARLDVVVDNFEKIDANNDGIVTRNELRAYALSTRRHVPMT